MTCLAGAVELPDTNAAIAAGAEIAKLNWPEASLVGPSVSGAIGVLTDGNGNVVTINASVNGQAETMSVTVTESAQADFGSVIGASTVSIVEQAFCTSNEVTSGAGILPIAALGGTFSGDLFDCANKVTGNCGAIKPVGNGANAWQNALENGIDADLQKHHGNWGDVDSDTGLAGVECANPGDVCNATDTEPGNMSGPFNAGIENLLSDTNGMSCPEAFNCESFEDVLGGTTPQTLNAVFGAGGVTSGFPNGFTKPSGWNDSLYGPYADAKNQQYYYNGSGVVCDSPRLATVPIVTYNDNWDIGTTAGSWPNGSNKRMKIIGFYTVYLSEPTTLSDFDTGGGKGKGGGGNGLDEVQAFVVWFGPDATCEDGSVFAPLGSIDVPSGVKLVAG